MPYVVPQVLVFQEFNLVAAAITAPLRAHIGGPHAYLLRHGVAGEKPLGLLGPYDPNGVHSFLWPERPAGALVDTSYTKLFLDQAQLLYFQDNVGTGVMITPVANRPNRIHAAGPGGFKANGSLYPRMSVLLDRDVQPGDQVHVHGNVTGVDYNLDTYVMGLAATQILPIVGVPTLDPGNGPTQTASATVVVDAANTSTVVLTAAATNYSALADGVLNDVYTITVIQSSTGHDFTTARIKVTTASGFDSAVSAAVGATAVAFTVGNRNLSLTFTQGGTPSDLVAGQIWTITVKDDYSHLTATAGGTYTGTKDTTYIVEVTRGGLFTDALKPQLTASTTTGVDVGGPYTVAAAGTAIAIGTKGVTFTLPNTGTPKGLRFGDRFYVNVTAAKDGIFSDLILGHSLPTALAGATDLDVKLSIQKDLQVGVNRVGFEPVVNWSQSATQITVKDGIIAYDPTWTNQGEPVALPVMAGTAYVEYRAWRSELAVDVRTISDVGDLDTLIPGPLHPDNPLKWGVFKALSNSNGTEVKYTAVRDPDLVDSWTDILALLIGREDVYNLVPLTHNPVVLDLYAAHVDDESSPEAGRWRAAFVSLQAQTTAVRASAANSTDGAVILATCGDDPDTTDTQNTILRVTSGNASFIQDGVVPGDIVRYLFSTSWGVESYEEYVIDAVFSEDTVRLVAGPGAAVTTASKMEVWHQNTKEEVATAVGRQAGAYSDRRVKAVWPDVISSGGVAMDGYYLCAALAGLRSGVVPHQSLTNVQIAGFDDVSRSTAYFNASQLNVMAGDGVWVVTQDPDGTVKTRHGVTTNNVDVNNREEMVVANIDSMSYVYLQQLRPLIGLMNVTPSALARIRVEIDATTSYLKTSGFTQTLGSQLIDGVIVQLAQHQTLLDRVVCVLDLTIPYPLNNIELHLII